MERGERKNDWKRKEGKEWSEGRKVARGERGGEGRKREREGEGEGRKEREGGRDIPPLKSILSKNY